MQVGWSTGIQAFFVFVCARTILSYGSLFFSSFPRSPGRTVDVIAVLPLWGDWNSNNVEPIIDLFVRAGLEYIFPKGLPPASRMGHLTIPITGDGYKMNATINFREVF